MNATWEARSRWHHPFTDIERVAELYDVRPDTIRHYLADQNNPFPREAERVGARKLWALSPLYRHIDTYRPQLRSRIPRLCPLTDSLGPATFLGTTSFTPERVQYAFALHAWQPADGRGPVAIAYPEELSHAASPYEIQEVAARFPALSAIAFATALTTNVAHPWNEERQPQIFVYDRDYTGPFPDNHGQGWPGYGWFDLANLLRVDLPWFSGGLTDIEAIQQWSPEAPVMSITPGMNGKLCYAPSIAAFGAGAERTPDQMALVNRATANANRRIAEWYEYTAEGHDRWPNSQGLRQAAVAAVDTRAAPLSPTEIAKLLHLHGPSHKATGDARRAGWVVDLWNPVIVDCSSVTVDELGELGEQWRARLQKLPEDTGLELGFAEPYARIGQWSPDPIFLRDPQDPDIWIIQSGNVFHLTLPAAIPYSIGRLQRVELNSSFMGGFFVDDAGISWPLPARNRQKYSIGDDSPRAYDLAATLSKLIDNASTAVPERGLPGREVRRLRDHLVANEAPLTMTRAEITALID